MLVAVLRLSTLWEISSGRDWAIHYLSPSNLLPATLPAPDRIKLSREFCVTEWIEPAFRELYTSDWLKLKDADVEKIGLKFFATAVKARAAVDRHRGRLAHCAPPVVCSPPCIPDSRIHERCVSAWQEVWWKRIGRHMLHPVNPCPFSDVIAYIERVDVKGMQPACLRETIHSLKTTDRFGYEEQVIRQAIDSIAAYQLTLVLPVS
jgi:hypothetical protein